MGANSPSQFLSSDTRQLYSALEGLEKITKMLAWYRWVSPHSFQPGTSVHQEIRSSVVAFYASIFTYQANLANYLGETTLKRFGINLLRPGRWDDLIKQVEEADQSCQRYLDSMAGPIWSLIAEQMDSISRGLLQITRLIQERNRIISWISQVDPFYAHNEVLRRLDDAYHSSASWLFESDEYKGWTASEFDFLILQGSVGIGKSSLISLAIEELNHERHQPTGLLLLYWSIQRAREWRSE